MSLDAARAVADAVLYEGYILYPYRASAQKNRSRWQFGVLMPPAYAAADGSEAARTQTEFVFEHASHTSVEVIVRFLQVQRRTTTGTFSAWDEAVEHEVQVRADGAGLFGEGRTSEFVVPGGEEREEHDGSAVIRRRERLSGAVSIRAAELPGPWRAARLTVEVANQTATGPVPAARDQALPAALVAVHMIISVSGGAFVSMTDPPEWAEAAVGACENIGCWPVLTGPDGSREIMLASPIILPDYPELAPESPGDLFDGTEIDEILTLRTLALADTEKAEARATDPRAAALIDRVEAMDGTAMSRLHGTIRPMSSGRTVPPDRPVSPETDAVIISGQRVTRGSRVTLRPGVRRTDAQDMFLVGRAAIVEAVLFDVEDAPYLAVLLADDPDQDLRAEHGRFLYFSPDEVEPSEAAP